MNSANNDFLQKIRQHKIVLPVLITAWLSCGGIYVVGSIIAPTLIAPFYTHLFGTIYFVMATVLYGKVFLEQRKKGKSTDQLNRWPPGSGRIFLITLGFLLAVALAFILIFL